MRNGQATRSLVNSVGVWMVLPALLMVLTGCATGGNRDTAYATYRHVQNLNQTTTGLSARVDAVDNEVRTIKGVMEENQRQLDSLSTRLTELTTAFYKVNNMTVPAPTTGAGRPVAVAPEQRPDAVTIEPPAAAGMSESGAKAVTPLPPISDTTSVQPATPGPATAAQPMDTAVPPAKPEPAMPPSEPVPPPQGQGGDPMAEYSRITKYYSDGNYEEALKQFDNYIRRFPNSDYCSYAQFWKARCYVKLNKMDQAVSEFETLRTRYPESSKIPMAMREEAKALIALNQKDKAEALLEKLIQNYPMDPATEGVKKMLDDLKRGG